MPLVQVILLICLMTFSEPAGQPESRQIETFLKKCEASRRGAIMRLEHEFRGLCSQKTTAESKRRQAEIRRQLRVLRSNEQPVIPPISFPPQIGAIGRLPRLACHVEHIFSSTEFLVICDFPVVITTVKDFVPRREAVVERVPILIRGLAAPGVREGQDLEMLQVFEVVGKEKCQTARNAVVEAPVLVEFDMATVVPYFRKSSHP